MNKEQVSLLLRSVSEFNEWRATHPNIYINLIWTDLRGANLRGANLSGANLTGANLTESDLREAKFCWANLRGANLTESDLREADFRGANLTEANLSKSNVTGTDFGWANLKRAGLTETNLAEANLNGANLAEANLTELVSQEKAKYPSTRERYMNKPMILNTSILTSYGIFNYRPVSLTEAQQMVSDWGFESAIGHESTAAAISELLHIRCPVNRIEYTQSVGSSALVFKLNGRPQEGVVLSREDLEHIGYSWGIITRTA